MANYRRMIELLGAPPENMIQATALRVGHRLWGKNPSTHEVQVVRLAIPFVLEWLLREDARTSSDDLDA